MGTGRGTRGTSAARTSWAARLRRRRSSALDATTGAFRALPPRREARLAVRENGSRILRLTTAAVLAYLAAKAVTPNLTDLTGPLTALLVVQASLFGSLRSGVGRVASVLTGVVVALGLSIWFGLTWWSLGLAIGLALTLAHAFRLGDHILETPISAMLVLGVAQHDLAATTRITNTLIGAGVGMAFNLLVPPDAAGRGVVAAVEDVARHLSAALERAGRELEEGFARSRVQRWLDDVHRVLPLVTGAEEALVVHEEARRFNPRSAAVGDTGPVLRPGLRALDAATLAVRHTLMSIMEEAPATVGTGTLPRIDPAAPPPDAPTSSEASPEAEAVRSAFAGVLTLMGEAVEAYGLFVAARARDETAPAAAALRDALEALRETRAMLTELLLVDPADDAAAWLLRGSILGGVDRFLVALDLETQAAPPPPAPTPLTRLLLARSARPRRDEIAADVGRRPPQGGPARYPIV
ncbi:FUSC family protein [Agilicoccus flavus]|uniref:FUSC family protein n=1 Tax=Agilicoccus flavus TaxID=2775968 RepID=UPI001CF6F093|nr:aromatic acid exporter family protein [Agilicoccus flavus]